MIGHCKPGAIVEIIHVETKGTIRFEVNHMVIDGLWVLWRAVWCQTHYLVFARIDFEPGVIGERRIKESQGMRERYFPQRHKSVVRAHPCRTGGPLSHPVHT